MAQPNPKVLSGAIWEGDAKWELTPCGRLSPCSLKNIVVSYICEHLGSVCSMRFVDSNRTVCYNKCHATSDKRESVKCETDLTQSVASGVAGGNEKSACKKASSIYPCNSQDPRKLNESADISTNENVSSVSNSSSSSVNLSCDNDEHIPYTLFDVPNYGKIYGKSDSIKPPGDSIERCEVLKENKLCFEFRHPGMYLSPNMAEQLLQELDRCGVLDDALLALFDSPRVFMDKLCIRRRGRRISIEALAPLLRRHNLRQLELHHSDLSSVVLTTALHNTSTATTLTSLSLQGYFPGATLPVRGGENNPFHEPYVQLFSKLPNLQELDLSYNKCLTAESLSAILVILPHLWKLSISHCVSVSSIEPLKCVAHQLLHVSLAGVVIHSIEDTISTLRTLTKLRYLDVSTINNNIEISHVECINEVLVDPWFAPELEYVDVANQSEVSVAVLQRFLNTHPRVRCVGLVSVPQCADFNAAKYPNVKFLRDVSLDESGTLTAINECLGHYRRSPHILNKLLPQVNIAATSTAATAPTQCHPHLVANILRCLETHQGRQELLVPGTYCLYNLTLGALGPALHPAILQAAVHATIHAMTRYMHNHQLQKNGLLLLCCDRVLHHVEFNQYWVAMMALQALHGGGHSDESVDLMAVGICSILATQLSSEQTAQLGSNPAFMRKLLQLVETRIHHSNADITLQFTLSTLWNLTDESPVTCHLFLDQFGLTLFIKLLLTFPDNAVVETKVLGLFNNVAEVSWLRKDLLKPSFIAMLRRQLQSSHIAVSYFAAGISAHLVCADREAWRAADDLPFTELLNELGSAVLVWEAPKEEMVAYKSFQPFLPLLNASEAPYVQLWAMWALHHVTTKNSKHYCPMLIREGIPDLLECLHDDALNTPPFVTKLAGQLLDLVSYYKNVESKMLPAGVSGHGGR